MTKVAAAGDSRHPLISFVIPVRDDAARLRICLAAVALSASAEGAVEVIVVDNGSVDESQAVATAAGATLLVQRHASVAELRNAGAARARGALLAFVDADHQIGRHWVGHAVAAFTDERVGAVGAQYQAPASGTWVQRGYDRLRTRRKGCGPVEWLGSGNLVVRRDVFAALGGFDSTLQTCEDVDFCRRIRRRGLVVLSDDRLVNIHLGDPPTLGAVFRGELWRGRDNVRVSLRPPMSWHGLPSLVMPLVTLGLMAAAAAGLASASARGATLALAAGSLFVLLTGARAARAVHRSAGGGPLAFGQTMAVSCAYDAGRALALVSRSSHGVRRRGARA